LKREQILSLTRMSPHFTSHYSKQMLSGCKTATQNTKQVKKVPIFRMETNLDSRFKLGLFGYNKKIHDKHTFLFLRIKVPTSQEGSTTASSHSGESKTTTAPTVIADHTSTCMQS